MNIKSSIRSQYHASLEMLHQAVEVCPDNLWLTPGPNSPYWQVAFHALFYTHLYLQMSEDEFVAWSKQAKRPVEALDGEATAKALDPVMREYANYKDILKKYVK